jgi:hypothetical protein
MLDAVCLLKLPVSISIRYRADFQHAETETPPLAVLNFTSATAAKQLHACTSDTIAKSACICRFKRISIRLTA